MEKVFKFTTNQKDYVLYFQDMKYSKYDFENFYFRKNSTKKEIEFLPGIFYKFDVNYPFLLKILLTILGLYNRELQSIKILPNILIEKFGKKIITIQFKNIRDDYCFFIENEKVYENEKKFQGQDEARFQYKYQHIEQEPEYLEIPTEKILFPHNSGGYGARCSLKGVLGNAGLFTPMIDKNYIFFNEYEMHCLIPCSEEIKDICKTCKNCMTTVALLKTGQFIGPTKDNDQDCLTVCACDGRYIIENGNHRACCAKAFGIPFMKAKVHKCIITGKKQKTLDSGNNQKVLDSFYLVFDKKGISRPIIHKYLETDGTDIGLIKLLQIIS